jgi:hypothetical protein
MEKFLLVNGKKEKLKEMGFVIIIMEINILVIIKII